jgi:site-specific recombinase XerD
MRVCERCALRLSDVYREQGMLRIEGRGHARWIMLSPNGWSQLLCYVDQPRPKGRIEEDSLFFSETSQPLTSNTITLLFHRLKKRAGMSETGVSPSALRETFAVCSLQAGGTPEALSDILGLTHVTAVKRYQRLIDQMSKSDQQKEPAEEHQSR